MVSVCCFKLRGFGVICNDAVDNQYHRHFCSLLCSDQKSELQGVLAGTWLKQRCPGWSTHLRKKSTCQVPSGDGTRNGSGALVAELRDPFPPAPQWWGAALWAWRLALWAPEWGSCFKRSCWATSSGSRQARHLLCLFIHSVITKPLLCARSNHSPSMKTLLSSPLPTFLEKKLTH